MALGWFLIGEGKLEEHLDEFPPNIEASSASDSVREARHRLKVKDGQKYNAVILCLVSVRCRNSADLTRCLSKTLCDFFSIIIFLSLEFGNIEFIVL